MHLLRGVGAFLGLADPEDPPNHEIPPPAATATPSSSTLSPPHPHRRELSPPPLIIYSRSQRAHIALLSQPETFVFNKIEQSPISSRFSFAKKLRLSRALPNPGLLERFVNQQFCPPEVTFAGGRSDLSLSVNVLQTEWGELFEENEDDEGLGPQGMRDECDCEGIVFGELDVWIDENQEEWVLVDDADADPAGVGEEMMSDGEGGGGAVVEEVVRPLPLRRNPFAAGAKIQFVVSRLSAPESFVQRTIQRFGSLVGTLPPFGLLHTVLVIGGIKFGWTDSSLCIPRAAGVKNAVLCIDLYEVVSREEYKSIISKVVEVVARWNATEEYSSLKSNCQQFVEAILEGIGMADALVRLPDAVMFALDRLKSNLSPEKQKMAIRFSEEFCEHFSLAERDMVFETHAQLDAFVQELCIDESGALENRFREYGFLLKSFDRAFWLELVKDQTLERCQPQQCPFGSPWETGSVWLVGNRHLPPLKKPSTSTQ